MQTETAQPARFFIQKLNCDLQATIFYIQILQMKEVSFLHCFLGPYDTTLKNIGSFSEPNLIKDT